MVRVIDDYVIDCPGDCYVVGKEVTVKNKKTGIMEKRMVKPRYFPTFNHCLEFIHRQLHMQVIWETDGDLGDAFRAMQAASDRFTDALNRLGV